MSRRTKKALLAGIEAAKRTLDDSIEKEKEDNEFLTGVPAIVEASPIDILPLHSGGLEAINMLSFVKVFKKMIALQDCK